VTIPERVGAVLTKELLKRRLERDLTVTPILYDKQIGDGSIDISLGTQFITNLRPNIGEIDPNNLSEEQIRKFQKQVVVSFQDQSVLHPGGFLLGATLEFIALPPDLCGFVLSRSSYGRTGLLIATATYIHPGWKGCLTLELENLGEVPIVLRPGAPVGQLVLMHAEPLPQPPLKSIPVGPTFGNLAEDIRWKKVRGR
jgi:dCTP deaminase